MQRFSSAFHFEVPLGLGNRNLLNKCQLFLLGGDKIKTIQKNKTTKRDILLLTLDTCNQFWAAGWKINRQQAQFYR